ncbi:MAG: 50S ribosomal protein L25 [candidate division SR1 bacterium]|nr:MAG: 50S ribosomal protein L25 [candidate division SR1 bacterium]
MKLKVQNRDVLGKKVKKLRKEGLIPLVVYGKSIEAPLHLTCDRVEFIKLYKKVGVSTPITLEGDGIEQMVLINDMQLDPVSDILLHVDFIAIKKGEKVSTEVNIVLTGEAPIEKNGEYQIQLLKDTIEVEAIPSKLPKEITVDISNIDDAASTIHLSDIKMPTGVELISDADQALITVSKLGGSGDESEEDVNPAGEEQTEESKEEAAE